ncbi:MAG: hypothetical protein WAU81_14545 [Candidatus Aminicenantales bacterium]
MAILIVLFVAPGQILCAELIQQQTQSAAEIQEKIAKLTQEAQTTTDMGRMQQIVKELSELGQALQKVLQEEVSKAAAEADAKAGGQTKSGAVPFTVPTPEEERAREAAVHEALQDRKDEPCYPVLFQKEYAGRYVGSDLPWISCVPLEIHLSWTIEERLIRTDKWPTGIINYVLEETYPGYLMLHYNQSDRRTVESFHLEGPSPVDDGRIGQRLVSANASGLLAEAYGVPDSYKTVGSNDKGAFNLLVEGRAEHATTAFHYDRMTGELNGSLAATRIDLPSKNLVERPYHLVYEIPQHISGVTNTVHGIVSLDEMMNGVREGRLVKEFSADLERDFTKVRLPEIYRRRGTVRMEVLFNALGTLRVTPGEGWKALGPDENDRFTPVSKTFSVRNAGEIPLEFKVEKAADWLKTDTPGGSLAPGQSRSVKVEIDQAKAGTLAKGTYTDAVRFINETNGSGTTARTATLEVDDEQRWEIRVVGFELDDTMKKQTFKDTDGRVKVHHKRVRFEWALTGRFVLKKEKGSWVYKSGQVTAAQVTPVPDFIPAGIYTCKVVKCSGSAPISTMVGTSIFGTYSGGKTGGTIQIYWPPMSPDGCVSCTSKHPAFPKTTYEGTFKANDFMTQIGLESFPLRDGYSQPVAKRDWLKYTVTFKRLK